MQWLQEKERIRRSIEPISGGTDSEHIDWLNGHGQCLVLLERCSMFLIIFQMLLFCLLDQGKGKPDLQLQNLKILRSHFSGKKLLKVFLAASFRNVILAELWANGFLPQRPAAGSQICH